MANKRYSEEFRRDAVELYRVTEGASLVDIAEELGCSKSALTRWVEQAGIATRGPARPPARTWRFRSRSPLSRNSDGCARRCEDSLHFQALQQRMGRSARAASSLGRTQPASLALFDVLATGGGDLRGRPFDERRGRLEQLARGWRPPLNLSPMTDDVDVAADWFESYTVAGLEGLIVKGELSPTLQVSAAG